MEDIKSLQLTVKFDNDISLIASPDKMDAFQRYTCGTEHSACILILEIKIYNTYKNVNISFYKALNS